MRPERADLAAAQSAAERLRRALFQHAAVLARSRTASAMTSWPDATTMEEN
jgi:hypothetical protein